ncbi:aspartic peptidase domain-containing protein [Bisporella sp. PMI_857]|nr:aspartic peptidase domain-containing protein [Bisporella sp. PMI_857]
MLLLLLRRVGLITALAAQCVNSSPAALTVTPSVQWYGDDGDWSAVSIRIGTPPQWVDVMVSTVSSETWIVGKGGCPSTPSDCNNMRGGLFTPGSSTSWQPQGFFELGVDKHLGNTGYAEYGFDNLTFGTTGVSLANAIVGAFNYTGTINSTQYLLGFFGLGIVPGSFNNTKVPSAISALLEKEDAIPSHSYGYTAGARYQDKGVLNSLTLGGYDANRLVPHDTSFTLNPSQNPEVYINSISVTNTGISSSLAYSSDRVSAVIDSSTPYLWLPKATCERFATALGLIYDESLNLYTFPTNSSQHETLQTSNITFAFSLSDISASPATVVITLPYAAFDLKLTFPAIPGTVSGAANATKYYFPLRQAASDAQYTIGRVFLQEAYLITDYERGNFSVHQAVHNSYQNTNIVAITRPSTSTFSGPETSQKGGTKLSTGAIVGVSIAIVAVVVLLIFIGICLYRRRKKRTIVDDEKATTAPTRSLFGRLRRRKEPLPHEASGDTSYPTEVGADATHERFELPAPIGPVELDSEYGTLDGTTENGSSTQDSNKLSAYERERRKLEHQQIAAAHAQRELDTYHPEKTENDVSSMPHYRPSDSLREIPDVESPLVSPVGPESGGSLTISNGAPSPVSPGFTSAPVSPMTAAPPTYTPIASTNVVYAGRLPPNVVLPPVVPKFVGPDGRTMSDESGSGSGSGSGLGSDPISSTLGSGFTDRESDDLYGATTRAPLSPVSPSGPAYALTGLDDGPVAPEEEGRYIPNARADAQVQEILAPWGSRRRLDGEDIVHVPQPAANRFSWEEERTQGTD